LAHFNRYRNDGEAVTSSRARSRWELAVPGRALFEAKKGGIQDHAISGFAQEILSDHAGNAEGPTVRRRAAAERVSSLLTWSGLLCGIQFWIPPVYY